jgi:hypothetical protein
VPRLSYKRIETKGAFKSSCERFGIEVIETYSNRLSSVEHLLGRKEVIKVSGMDRERG